jgi:hypothetical protein
MPGGTRNNDQGYAAQVQLAKNEKVTQQMTNTSLQACLQPNTRRPDQSV